MSIISVKTRYIASAPSLKHRWHFISDLHFRRRIAFFAVENLVNSSDFRCFACIQSNGFDLSEVIQDLLTQAYPANFFLSQSLKCEHFAVFFSFHRSNPWRTYSGLKPKVSQIFLKEKIQSLFFSKIHSSASVKSLPALPRLAKRLSW